MLHRTPAGRSAAAIPARLARLSRPLVVVLHALSPCSHMTQTIYCDSTDEADLAVDALTDEGWTFTREEVRA